MKLDYPWLYKLGGLLGSATIPMWMRTLDCRAVFYDREVDPGWPGCRTPKIYVSWHEYILSPLFLRGHCNIALLLSQHRDAEMLTHAARLMGFDCIRGSTNRGGVAAIRKLLRKGRGMHMAITPDGPRGPRRRLAAGSIYMASKLGLPLVAVGYGYDRPWRARSWDRFAVPRPGSRARCVLSPEIHIPHDLDRHGMEHFRVKVEQVLNRLSHEAETWAASTARMAGELVVRPERVGPLAPPEPTPTLLPGPHWQERASEPRADKPVCVEGSHGDRIEEGAEADVHCSKYGHEIV